MNRSMYPAVAFFLAIGVVACVEDTPTGVVVRPDATPRLTLVNGPVVPINGGMVTAPIVTIDNASGEQTDPQVSGDVACYQDSDLLIVRYFRFSTGVSMTIPGDGQQCSIDGTRIAFSRPGSIPDPNGGPAAVEVSSVHLFDIGTAIETVLDPNGTAVRRETGIGSNTVAFMDYILSGGLIQSSTLRVTDVASPTQSQPLSASPGIDDRLNVSPSGSLVVWRRLDPNGSQVMRVERVAGAWGAPVQLATPTGYGENPDTDGTYVVWDADDDIFIQDVAGGPITQLTLSGCEDDPAISAGVVVFRHSDCSGDHDVWAYFIATNTLLQVTNTANLREDFPRIDVLSSGNLRVVWAAKDPVTDQHDIYGTTFTPSGGPPGPPTPTFTFGGFLQPIRAQPILNDVKAGGTVPVKFSLGGQVQGPIFAPGSPTSTPIDCSTRIQTGSPSPLGTPTSPVVPKYDSSTNSYAFLWTPMRVWAQTCRRLTLQFVDGTSASADFFMK